jgi:hypothetical protein
MRETDLYAPVKAFLEAQGYEVKAEIDGCDVVALRGDEPPVVVELKRAVSLKLLLQGVDRQAMTDAVYLAVAPPKRRDLSDVKSLCRRLGLGLLLVGPRAVEAALDPAPYRPRKDARRAGMMLREFHRRVGDPNEGGASRRTPTMTAYRQDALRCLRHLAQSGGEARLALLRAQTGVERAGAILRDDHYGWFARKERGLYALTPKGAEALTAFEAALAAL